MLTDEELLELAGKNAFERGRAYHRDSRVTLERKITTAIYAQAHGTHRYSLWIKRSGKELRWDCECPAADGDAFCKHLVATVLGDICYPRINPATAEIATSTGAMTLTTSIQKSLSPFFVARELQANRACCSAASCSAIVLS